MLSQRDKLVLFAGLAYLTFAVFSGPVRMTLTQIGLSPLIYLPNGLLLLAALWTVLDEPLKEGFTAVRLIALTVLLSAVLVGLQHNPIKQVAMGIWVLLPFWYGLSCGAVLLRHWDRVQQALPVLWAFATFGALANLIITWPWEGFSYSVGGLDVEGSREWWAAGGTKRVAGFARSSFDAAVQVQLLGIATALKQSRLSSRLLVWALTFAAIYVTTSKGVLLVFLALTPLIVLRQLLPTLLHRPQPICVGLLGLALPTSSLLFSFTPDTSGGASIVNALSSFYDRLNDMWPRAWDLLADQGNLLLGRGIGGIGTAQTYFEAERFNAADNLFMYWFVVFGLVALPGFLLMLLRTLRLNPFRSPEHLVVFSLLMATLVYGLTTNIVENAAFAIAAGLVIRFLAESPKPAALEKLS